MNYINDKQTTIKQIQKMLQSKETSILQEGVKKLLAMNLQNNSLNLEASFSKSIKTVIDSVKELFGELKEEIKKIVNSIDKNSSTEEIKKIYIKPKTEDTILINTLNSLKESNENLITSSLGMLSSILPQLNKGQYSDFRDEQQEEETMFHQANIDNTLNSIYELLLNKQELQPIQIEQQEKEESSSNFGMLSSIFGLLKNPSWYQKLFSAGKVALGIASIIYGSKKFYDGIMSSMGVIGRNLDLSKLGDWWEAIKLGFGNVVSSITGLPLKSIYDNITYFSDLVGYLWDNTITKNILPLLNGYQAFMDNIGQYIIKASTFIFDLPSYLIQGIGNILDNLGFSIGNTIKEIGEMINVGEALSKLFSHPLDFLQKVVGNIYTYVSAIANYLGSWGGWNQGFTKSFSDALKESKSQTEVITQPQIQKIITKEEIIKEQKQKKEKIEGSYQKAKSVLAEDDYQIKNFKLTEKRQGKTGLLGTGDIKVLTKSQEETQTELIEFLKENYPAIDPNEITIMETLKLMKESMAHIDELMNEIYEPIDELSILPMDLNQKNTQIDFVKPRSYLETKEQAKRQSEMINAMTSNNVQVSTGGNTSTINNNTVIQYSPHSALESQKLRAVSGR